MCSRSIAGYDRINQRKIATGNGIPDRRMIDIFDSFCR
jgi:hypothetical protein